MMRSTYDPAVAQIILDRMAEGEGMDAICSDNQMPPRRIVRRWLVTVPQFRADYETARMLQGETISDEILALEAAILTGELAVKQKNGTVLLVPITTGKAMAAIASKQWRMQRLAPARWGNKIEQTVQMHVDPRDLTDAQLAAIAAGADAGVGSEGATRAPAGPGKPH